MSWERGERGETRGTGLKPNYKRHPAKVANRPTPLGPPASSLPVAKP
ncbi:MAG: hypothetical protein KME26_22765 [Oscillatoria princeps RMCB-10]|nr:hypothetical protein [Oscillatoria princeps RMCB-10]